MSDVQEYQTNLGRSFSTMLDDVNLSDIQAAGEAIWQSVHSHPHSASCECPAIEALAVLYELGYKVVKA